MFTPPHPLSGAAARVKDAHHAESKSHITLTMSSAPSQEDDETPYGGDIQAAMAANDRDAIRTIMRMREAAAKPHSGAPAAAGRLSVEDFSCPICCELLYKPCVNACGHTFCFWCLHKAMDPLADSRCPLCRAGFKHFAAPCDALQGFLAGRFPGTMAARACSVREMEDPNPNPNPKPNP